MATILIIDDNETVREGLSHVVKKMGHTPVTAVNGKDGLEKFKAEYGFYPPSRVRLYNNYSSYSNSPLDADSQKFLQFLCKNKAWTNVNWAGGNGAWSGSFPSSSEPASSASCNRQTGQPSPLSPCG